MKPKKDNRLDTQQWHRWFAWHKIEIEKLRTDVWLEMVERKRVYTSPDKYFYMYRDIDWLA